jgi:hypothetical protein
MKLKFLFIIVLVLLSSVQSVLACTYRNVYWRYGTPDANDQSLSPGDQLIKWDSRVPISLVFSNQIDSLSQAKIIAQTTEMTGYRPAARTHNSNNYTPNVGEVFVRIDPSLPNNAAGNTNLQRSTGSDQVAIYYAAAVISILSIAVIETGVYEHEFTHVLGIWHKDYVSQYRFSSSKQEWVTRKTFVKPLMFYTTGGVQTKQERDFVKYFFTNNIPEQGILRGNIGNVKGANLVAQNTKTKELYSVNVDHDGTGDGSFELLLPQGHYVLWVEPMTEFRNYVIGYWTGAHYNVTDKKGEKSPMFINGDKLSKKKNTPVRILAGQINNLKIED